MLSDTDGVAVLVYDLDFGDGLAGCFVNRDHFVVAVDGVAEVNRGREAHVVVAVGHDGHSSS